MDGKNYMLWKRVMLLAISAKRKTSYITRDDEPAESASEAHLKWKENDDLVFSWILNSLSNELVAVFVNAKTAKALWKEIEQRYGESNGQLIFHLRKQICSLTQGGMLLVDYFNQMKRMWDEYAILKPMDNCTCGESRLLAQTQLEEEQLMQFLSGLNVEFDHIRDQILIMEPLPQVNKAFSMLTRIEKQRNVSSVQNSTEFVNYSSGNKSQGIAGRTNSSGGGSSYGNGSNQSGRNGNGYTSNVKNKSKSDKFCSYCKKEGHDRADCFRIKGYLDWFKGKRVTGPAKHQAHMTQEEANDSESPLSYDQNEGDSYKKETMQEQREVQKALKGKSIEREYSAYAGFAGACAGPEM